MSHEPGVSHPLTSSDDMGNDNLSFIPESKRICCLSFHRCSASCHSSCPGANHIAPGCQSQNSPPCCQHPQLISAKPKLGTYEIDKTIGKGIFSVVKLARHTITGINLAVKVIDKTCLDADHLVKVYREAVILKKLHHPNIVKLFQVMETPRLLCLVMEYLPNGEVFDYIATHGRFSEAEARVKFFDVLSAVDYTHSCGIVHRDLKAENLLFDADMNVKLIDFSFGTHHRASDTHSLLTTWCGSPPYAAPEIFKGEPYIGVKADIWSLGVVLYVMVCGMLPFDAQPLSHLKNQVLSACFRVPYWLSLTCERLIRSMLSKQPSKRPSTREIFRHPWFTEPLPRVAELSSTPSDSAPTDLMDNVPSRIDLSDELTDRLSHVPNMERGTNLAADLELGHIDEFVLLIMESYGMSRAKIMESLDSRAYDHLMATYLLLGEKVRQHQCSLNLPALAEALTSSTTCTREVGFDRSDASIPVVRHQKHSRADSAVGSVSEIDANEFLLPSKPHVSDFETSIPLYSSVTGSHVMCPTDNVSSDHHRLFTLDEVLPCSAECRIPDSGSAVPVPNWSTHSSSSKPTVFASYSATDSNCQAPATNPMEVISDKPWLVELDTLPVTNETVASTSPRRTLARRKYGVFTPPPCLDQLTRAVLAQQVSTVDEQVTKTEDDS